MADLLGVPLKKPTDVDVIKPLKNLIRGTYNVTDKQEDFNDEITEFSKLRSSAVWRSLEKYESSLEIIYGYYDQLIALESKLPANEVQIPFKWKDAFEKSSIFGARMSLTVSSLAYERVCVLFNIAALQSQIASAQCLDTDDGLKLAAKLFQQASGIFLHLKQTVMVAIQQEPTPDLNPDTLHILSCLMLAQAQEIFVWKAIQDKMKDGVISKLCTQADELYSDVLKQFQKEHLRHLWDKEWKSNVAGKQAAFHGLAEYYHSLVCKSSKAVGEEIARLELAVELLKAAQTRSGKQNFFSDYLLRAQAHLTEAKKDNDFIYHERVPEAKSLTPLGKAQLVKSLPVPQQLSSNFKDIFDRLCPVVVHQALTACDSRKNDIVNVEINKLREASQTLNSILSSLNLPACIEVTSGNDLPQSLIDKSNAVKEAGGLREIENTIKDLPELLQRNQDILNESYRLLNEEKESDDQLRSQFEEKWTRTPSDKLTETFRNNASKYREIINTAIKADSVVRAKFDEHRRGIELLSLPTEELRKAVPSVAKGQSSLNQASSAVNTLRQLMDDVDAIKAEREVIESELKSATVDLKQTFLKALTDDGAISEANISVGALGRVYGPLQNQVQDSLRRQTVLIEKIQKAHEQFVRENSGLPSGRDDILKEIAAAYDGYMELKTITSDGAKFYNDLTQLLVVNQNKISDFCFARKTEKEELLKDLTQSASRQTPVSVPQVPSHFASSNAQGGTMSSVPYPTSNYPASMPVPYGGAGVVPYPPYVPPPMPQGYNPYATLPYPQQPQPQQQQQQQQQPQNYYGYPTGSYPYPPGNPPQHNPHQGW